MKTHEHFLIKLAEEAIEVALEVSKLLHKTLIFGKDEVNVLNPTGPTNSERLEDELNDLFAIICILVGEGIIKKDWLNEDKVNRKVDKVKLFLNRSIELGITES